MLDSNANLDNLPTLNVNPENIQLSPAVEPYPRQLWAAASICCKPQSLWIADLPNNSNLESIIVSFMPQRKSLLKGNFLNVVLPSVDSPKLFSKETGQEIITPSEPKLERENKHLNSTNTIEKLEKRVEELEKQDSPKVE